MPPNCRGICNASSLRSNVRQCQPNRIPPKDRFFACFAPRQAWTTGLAMRGFSTLGAEARIRATDADERDGEHGKECAVRGTMLASDPATPRRDTTVTHTPKVRYVTSSEWLHRAPPAPKRPPSGELFELNGKCLLGRDRGGKNNRPQVETIHEPPSSFSGARLRNAAATSPFTPAELESLHQIATQATMVDRQTLARIEGKKRRTPDRQQMLNRGKLSFDWRIPLKALLKHSEQRSSAAGRQQAGNEEDLALLRRVQQESTLYRSKHVEQIPEPSCWTRQNLAQYIHDLTHSTVPTAQMSFLYGPEANHQAAVEDKLMSLLQDREVQIHLSLTAYHLVMSWLQESSRIDSSRRLPYAMAELELYPTSRTFNILLSHSAKINDLFALTVGIQLMLKCGIAPDAWTWKCLCECVESRTVKRLIQANMAAIGLMEERIIVRAMATDLARGDAASYLQRGEQISNLISEYDGRYGPHWLGVHAANVIMHEAGLLGRLDQALGMLQIMVERGCQPDRTTLEVLLKGSRTMGATTGEVEGAVEIVRIFARKFKIEPDAKCYDVLFGMGWDLRRANLCRAVWRHACLRGEVTSTMSVRVMKALTFGAGGTDEQRSESPTAGSISVKVPTPAEEGTRASFYTGPAKIIAGIVALNEDWPQQKRIWDEYRAVLSSGDDGQRLTEAARAVRDADRTISQHLNFAASCSFADLLQIANKTDSSWREKAEMQAALAVKKRREAKQKHPKGSSTSSTDVGEQQQQKEQPTCQDEQLDLDWMLRWAVRVDVVHRRNMVWRRIRPGSGYGFTPPLAMKQPQR